MDEHICIRQPSTLALNYSNRRLWRVISLCINVIRVSHLFLVVQRRPGLCDLVRAANNTNVIRHHLDQAPIMDPMMRTSLPKYKHNSGKNLQISAIRMANTLHEGDPIVSFAPATGLLRVTPPAIVP